MRVREGAPRLGPEGGGCLILCVCLMQFHCTPILYQPWSGPAGEFSEMYKVTGRKDRAIRTAGSGVEYRDNGWKWKAWSTVERCREARRRQSGCSDRCEATKSQ